MTVREDDENLDRAGKSSSESRDTYPVFRPAGRASAADKPRPQTDATRAKSARVRVALLARTASEQQGEDGRTAAAQLQRLRDYARRHGWQIIAEVVEPTTGGRDSDRPGIGRILALAGRGRFDLLVIESKTRLSRNPRQFHCLLKALERDGVAVHVVVTSRLGEVLMSEAAKGRTLRSRFPVQKDLRAQRSSPSSRRDGQGE